LPCEFATKWKNNREVADKLRHFTGTGPRNEAWEEEWPYRTWEINMPDNSKPREWSENLIGLMPFEWEADLTDFCNWDVISDVHPPVT
jgi:hypothetical protein